jgi:hypothetical protein
MGAEPAETGDVGASDTRVSAEEHGFSCDVADSCALSLANGELSYSAVRASKQYFTVRVPLAHRVPYSLHNSNFSVAVPTIEDMDPDTNPTSDEQDSMRAFCGMCRLTLILESVA